MKLRQMYVIFSFIVVSAVAVNVAMETQYTTSRYGSTGDEVRTIQTKLKQWGYYTGGIDGIYGTNTRTAVRYFQSKNGLTVDGIAGPQTLKALGIRSTATSSSNDSKLLARIISAEARGEPYQGQVAVGAVIINRTKHPSFPKTIAGVIYQPGAFTAITDGQWNKSVVESANRAAQDALNGWDPSRGSIYYYNPAKTTSKWIYSRPVVCRIGSHIFAK